MEAFDELRCRGDEAERAVRHTQLSHPHEYGRSTDVQTDLPTEGALYMLKMEVTNNLNKLSEV